MRGLGRFGFAEAALVITAGRRADPAGAGRRWPAAAPAPARGKPAGCRRGSGPQPIVGYLMLDRPTAVFADFPTDYQLGYGIFVALGGAAWCWRSPGLRIRSAELARQGRDER